VKQLSFVLPIAALLAILFYLNVSGTSPFRLPSPLVGKPAPGFALPALTGARSFTHRDLTASHVSVVNFWASWCTPCRAEHPLLAALAAQHDVKLYGVAWKNKPGDARAFLATLGNPFARVDLDERGRTGIDWSIEGVPETFIVDGHGIVRAHYAGPLTPQIMSRIILPALAHTAS
jgi:cytochrome c biogenesis protein CcmG, thiol:disulfide interchange protein DsbE